MHRVSLVLALAVLALAPAAARAGDPPLTVPKDRLAASLKCAGTLKGAARQPLMLVTGTGASGDEAYAIGKGAFDAWGAPVCWVNFPDYTTGDVQIAVQYLVAGIRTEARRAGRPIAVFGISQGGLLPRIALTYWPSLRAKVTDVLAAAGTQHGTNVFTTAACLPGGCAPAVWQQAAGSKFLAALNAQPDETPGPTAWTTVRSTSDETVQPQGGPHPASALQGATNVLIQSVCPGRTTSHIGTALDSVTFAAFRDAITHPGPAKLTRLPKDVCAQPYATGLDEAGTVSLLALADGLTSGRGSDATNKVLREPAVQSLFRRRVRA